MSMQKVSRNLLVGIEHVAIPTEDMDATVEFYTSLGFSVEFKCINNGSKVAFLKLGNLVLETYEVDKTADCNGSVDHFAIETNNVEELYNEIRNSYKVVTNGIEELPFWNNGVRFFKIKGPSGEDVEFLERL